MCRSKALSLCLLCLSFCSQAFAAQESHYALAESAYRQKNFARSLQEYDRALRLESGINTAAVHYMKGNCLMQLRQPAAADQEYAQAQLLAPNSQTARYCEQARVNIRQITQAPNTAPRSAAGKGKAITNDDEHDEDNENNENNEKDADSPKAIAHDTNGKKVSPGTLDLIAKQAALAQKRALEIGNVAAENERIKAQNEARSLQARLERAASTPKNGSTEPLALTPAQLEAIKGQAAAGSEQLKQAGEWKAQQRKQESEDKAEEIRRQAENLQSQLINYRPNINSDIKLNPVGTNLYIRNYSNGLAPIMPMKANTGLLPSYKNATEGIKGSMTSNQTSLQKIDARGTSNATSASIDVKGKLIGGPKPTQAEHP